MKKDSGVPPVLDQIKLATLNLSCFETSHVAPDGFNPMETFSQALLEHDPDVICLQEATHDGESFYETLLPGYVCLGKASAHVEYAMLLLCQGVLGCSCQSNQASR
jgi:endonuclease/exonuclease/phosphatase family metal-dependent hydrolase